jgi:O-antigen ligase/tetratricopeptide (TPR) repeat protein
MAVEGLLATLLLFMPLAFGAVEAWSELAVIAAATILAGIVALRTALDRTFRPPWTAAYVPMALFIALVVWQLIPLPASILRLVSPATVATRTELLGEAGQGGGTISLYPLATARGLRLVLAAAAIFGVTAAVFRTAPQIKRLLTIVFVIGCLEAALAVLQIVTHADGIFWAIDAGPRRLSSGSFINYSNFSQFMNLSIGAGAALLLVRIQEEHRRSRWADDAMRPFGGLRVQAQAPLLAGLVLCSLSVFTSMSRNGAISLVASGIAMAAALYASGTLSRRGWLLAMLPLATAAALLLFAFDAVADRLATLHDSEQFSDRWQLTLDVLRAWRRFPVWGVGLDAHEVVFPMFDRSVTREVAGHADNDYAQLLEETGAVGALLVAAFVGIIGYQIYKLCRRGRTSISAAVFGLAFGLLAVAIHSATDFGQRLPAVFCLSAIACGVVVQLTRLERESKEKRTRAPHSAPRRAIRQGAAYAALAAIVTIGGWCLLAGYRTFLADEWWAMAYQIEDRIRAAAAGADDEDYQDLISASERALAYSPRNVVYGYWLNARRWQAVSRGLSTSSREAEYPAEVKPIVVRIADELAGVRRNCPTYGPPYALEGQLRLFVLGDPRGGELIEQGVRLASYDPPTCLIAGEVAAREGRADEAARLISRAVSLDGGFYQEALEILLFTLKRPDIARQLAGEDVARLLLLAQLCESSAEYGQLGPELRQQAEAALRRRAAADNASPAELAALGHIDYERGAFPESIALYRRALKLDYNQPSWRMELAHALAETGDYEQAKHEAQICVRLRPTSEAREFVEEMTQRAMKEP